MSNHPSTSKYVALPGHQASRLGSYPSREHDHIGAYFLPCQGSTFSQSTLERLNDRPTVHNSAPTYFASKVTPLCDFSTR